MWSVCGHVVQEMIAESFSRPCSTRRAQYPSFHPVYGTESIRIRRAVARLKI